MKNQTEQKELAVVRQCEETPARFSPVSAVDIGALMEAAVKQGSAMEVIKEIRQMESEFHARTAKQAFDEAMSAFQEECPVILKQKSVPDRSGKTAYVYAPIEAIEVQIRPLLRKHGFSHTFDTDTTSAVGWVIAQCIVKHIGGHERVSSAKFPLGTQTQIMSTTQVYAAALTFANRRALANAYGLVLAGEDLDGATGKLKPRGPSTMQPTERDPALKSLAKELWDLLKPVRGDKQNWDTANKWMFENEVLDGANVEDVAPDLSAKRFHEVIEAVKGKLP